MLEKIKNVMADKLDIDPDEITLDADLKKDLQLDSLSVLELVMALEDEYGIHVPDEDLMKLSKVSDVVEYLESVGIEE
ncbi:MAG: acyl carrier protein [Lachnospiraceae bacterium]|nr:acyl carrier protein [Lachnospiraceae bacterium]